METCFFQAAALVEKTILQERPKNVLEISAFSCAYGRLIADILFRYGFQLHEAELPPFPAAVFFYFPPPTSPSRRETWNQRRPASERTP